MWSIVKKEFNQFFSNLIGYISIILFLLINGVFLFVLEDSNIFNYGYASLDKFFELAPWVLLFLIPAITMRCFSDEYKFGTFETLKTKPLSSNQIVMGKYIAILLIVLLVLMPSLIYVVTIKSLSATGIIDNGAIIGSYIGLVFLCAVYAAVGLCCSGLTSNAVVAFLLSVFVCLLLYFGFSAISKLSFLQGNIGFYIEMFGIDFHYKNISRGVIDTRDVVYFFSIIFMSVFITSKKISNN
jgi:ABC-2 type transport system permease protein